MQVAEDSGTNDREILAYAYEPVTLHWSPWTLNF